MLYLVGLGLGDAADITVKGLEIVRRADKVFLEAYTSVLSVGKEALEAFYGREVVLADREQVEQGTDSILGPAREGDVVLLVVGDPLGATTHSDLLLQAQQQGVQWRVVHNASILTAVGACGLQLYTFGETVSLVMWTSSWQPDSYVDKIERNLSHGLHTLCLLDIKMKEQSVEDMMKGRKVFQPPRFMTVPQAAEQLLTVIQRRRDQGRPFTALTPSTPCVAMARLGADDQVIVHCDLSAMLEVELGPPLHSLVVVGHTHPLEKDMLALFAKHTSPTAQED